MPRAGAAPAESRVPVRPTTQWREKQIKDDEVKEKNLRGMMSFATSGAPSSSGSTDQLTPAHSSQSG